MGLFKMSCSSYDKNLQRLPNPNPDPRNFKILRNKTIGNFLIVEILYPDCTNYEGKKILVYYGITLKDLKSQKTIDPHFCDNPSYYSPIARFIPTEGGWSLACILASSLKM